MFGIKDLKMELERLTNSFNSHAFRTTNLIKDLYKKGVKPKYNIGDFVYAKSIHPYLGIRNTSGNVCHIEVVVSDYNAYYYYEVYDKDGVKEKFTENELSKTKIKGCK